MAIGDFLKQQRAKHGGKGYWSRLAVANRAEISDAYLFQLEQNKNTKPSPDILKKLAEALRVSYEDLMDAAGYLPEKHDSPKTVEIPLLGECPASKFNFAYVESHIKDYVVVNKDFVKDKNCFAIRVKGDCLKEIGIFDKDIVIVSPNAEIKNGDIVIARCGDECTLKKFFRTNEEQIVLQPCNHEYQPIIVDLKKDNVEIIGKVIRALKTFE